ncbi:hypothetical protein [Acinetobacter bereziniae]|uniref:hypothetical protein n=1 Tax=Acinetobacter bereziniae TaxID=106648 RepID=UPI0021D2FD64|nr:hypothetical protein [Acinetobacter bereziniae]MCU4601515.1 hypothetical protein [Acinetobacter bereziniae]
MKFFKYLIFILLSFLSTLTLACYQVKFNSFTSPIKKSQGEACASIVGQKTTTGDTVVKSVYSFEHNIHFCKIDTKNSKGELVGWDSYNDGPYYVDCQIKCEPGTKRFLDGYITSQTGTPPDEVCFAGCLHKSDGGGTAFDTPNGNLSWGFNAETTGMECDQDTPKGEDKPITPVDPNMKPEDCKNANGSNAYCDKPTDKNCPTGYKQGMFNNKQICIKNSDNPDPNKPNPNDPNNGDGKGEGNCNGTNNCNTTEFDDSKIIEAINASTSAISNAIASLSNTITNGLNSLASSINSVSSAINANTNAVNANGDKVTNAVNSGTNATKENGKKLDGIKDGIDKGNGFLKEIKDWLFADVPDTGSEPAPSREFKVEDLKTDLFKVSGQCPISKSFTFKGHTFTLDLSNFCYVLEIMGLIVGIAACLHGIAILSENT